MTNQYVKKKIFSESSILSTTKLTFNQKRLNKELDEAIDSNVIMTLKDFLKKNKNDQDLRYVLNSRRGKSRLKLLLDFSYQDIEIMDLLLKAGLNTNIQDDEGKTALHYAVDYNSLENVKLILKSSAKPNLQDKDGKTPLHYASSGEENYIEVINTLLEKGAKIDIQDKCGNTPLHYAAIAGYTDIVKTLVEADVGRECIRLQNRDGDTPLHLGFYRISDSAVEVILLENAKNLNIKNKLGLDPLLMSASFSHSDTLRSLLRKEGTNIQSTDKEGNTALHHAVCNSYSGNSVKTTLNTMISDSSFCKDGALSKNSAFENTNILIAKGMNVNALNKNGHTPLFLAVDNQDCNVVKYLLENGADARIADNKNGYTAAYYALKQNDLEMLKLFLPSSSSSIRNNIKDALIETIETDEQMTEIAQSIVEKIVPNIKIDTNIEAIKTQIVEILPKNIEKEAFRIIQNDIVKILVNNVQNRLGALSIVDKKGNTLLHHAVRWGCGRDVLNFLVKNGVDINAKNKNDVASIHIAAKYGNIDHISFFIEKGENLNVQCSKFKQSEIEILKKNVITNGNIDAGGVINLVNDSEFKKSSPMHLASTDDSVDTLLLGGANSNIKDGRGLTPIQIAIIKACKEDFK